MSMYRCRFITTGLMVALMACLGMVNVSSAQATSSDEALAAVAKAESIVAEAKASIKEGKAMVDLIPEDSPLLPEVGQMLKEVSSNWKLANDSLAAANESATKIASTTNADIAGDYALLAKVNSTTAVSGAKVVEIGIAYVEAVANNKTESLDIIRSTMQDALAASSQVKFNCDKVKKIISQKYSK